MNRLAAALIVSGIGLALAPAAVAQPRRHIHRPVVTTEAPPLTVRPRSYLDPGDVVPEGSLNEYVWVPAQPRTDLYDTGGLSWRYGDSTLPGPLDPPGRPEPIIEF